MSIQLKKTNDELAQLRAATGAVGNAAIVDPTEPANTIQLLKGLLSQLQGTGAGATDVTIMDNTVIVSVSQTRPADTTAYAALDVVGQDPAANMEFATGLTAGTGFVIFGARLRIDVADIPAGMTSFRLHLFNAAPTAITDNLAFNLIAADRDKYIDYIEVSGIQDLGDTVWLRANEANITCKLVTASLFGVLQTVGAYTPTASVVKTVSLIIAPL